MQSNQDRLLAIHSPKALSRARQKRSPDSIYFNNLLRSARGQNKPLIYVDITDYVLFFLYRSHVSGIQRVVHYLLKYADFSEVSPGASVIYCMTHPESGCFAHISPSLLARLIDFVDVCAEPSTIHKCANEILSESSFKPRLSLNSLDILLIPGGPWASVLQLNLYQLEKIRIGFRCYCVCYDLIPIDFPEFCATGLTDVFKTTYHKLSRIVNGYISISQYSDSSIRAYEKKRGLKRHPSMYSHWRLGDFDGDLSLSSSKPPDELKKFCEQIKQKGFILVVSTIEPRKNHYTLLRAWRLLIQKCDFTDDDLPALVFAGKIGWNSENLVDQIHSLQLSGVKAYILEGMTDACLDWLYLNCEFSVMPSYVEGWGLSITESMMRGRVCLTSNTSSMVEAASGVAPLFDPYNARELCDMLYDFIFGGQLEQHQNRLAHYRPVSWFQSAVEFYQKLAIMTSNEQDSHNSSLLVTQEFGSSHMAVDMTKSSSWTPLSSIDYLSVLSCWMPVTHDGRVSPFSSRPWIDIKIPKGSSIIKVDLANLANPSNHPTINVYDSNNHLISVKSAVTMLPQGSCIAYAYVNCLSSHEKYFNARVIFVDQRDDFAYGDCLLPSVEIASRDWFSIDRIEVISS